MFKKIWNRFLNLETLEKKTFWIVGPAIVLIGFISVFTIVGYADKTYAIISILSYIIFPFVTMLFCYRSQDYRHCYPLLCIGTSAVLVPMLFLLNGGFYSGMPIICTAASVICVFCSSKKWRYISIALSYAGNGIAFFVCKHFDFVVEQLEQSWIENDIIYAYYMISAVLFIMLDMVLAQTRSYAVDSKILSKYMDDSVRKRLLMQQNPDETNLEDDIVRKRVTILFADISSFTATTEKMTPEQSAEYVNTFLEIADEKIHLNHGTVDKYIGDCVMAFWIDENKDGSGILDAVKAVMDIHAELKRYTQDIYDRFHVEMDFSSGIEYGDVVLGSMGSERRKDFTAIGDVVNTASRIQGNANRGELLISESLYPMVKDKLNLKEAGKPHYLKGKTNPVQLYQVLGFKEKYENAINVNTFGLEQSHYELYVCGCRGSYPVSGMRFAQFGGETSCYLLKKKDYALVIDCGTGLDVAEEIMKDCTHVDILLTHLHYDHILGLLKTNVWPKGATISIYGCFNRWGGFQRIDDYMANPFWPTCLPQMEHRDVNVNETFVLNKEIEVTFYPSAHPGNACVARVVIDGKKICFFADMENTDCLDDDIAKEAYLLFYDGMFEDENTHPSWGHSTWQKAVAYAAKENVRRLVITHHNPEKGDRDLRHIEKLARARFENTVLARTGDKYII